MSVFPRGSPTARWPRCVLVRCWRHNGEPCAGPGGLVDTTLVATPCERSPCSPVSFSRCWSVRYDEAPASRWRWTHAVSTGPESARVHVRCVSPAPIWRLRDRESSSQQLPSPRRSPPVRGIRCSRSGQRSRGSLFQATAELREMAQLILAELADHVFLHAAQVRPSRATEHLVTRVGEYGVVAASVPFGRHPADQPFSSQAVDEPRQSTRRQHHLFGQLTHT